MLIHTYCRPKQNCPNQQQFNVVGFSKSPFQSSTPRSTVENKDPELPSKGDGDANSSNDRAVAGEPEGGGTNWLSKSKYKRVKEKFKKQPISVVFNYSSFELSKDMEKILNRCLNF